MPAGAGAGAGSGAGAGGACWGAGAGAGVETGAGAGVSTRCSWGDGISRIAVRLTICRGLSSTSSSGTGCGRTSTTTAPVIRSWAPRRRPLGSATAVQARVATPSPNVGSPATPRTIVRSTAAGMPIGRPSSSRTTRSPTMPLPGDTPAIPSTTAKARPTTSTTPAITAIPAQVSPGSMRYRYAA